MVVAALAPGPAQGMGHAVAGPAAKELGLLQW